MNNTINYGYALADYENLKLELKDRQGAAELFRYIESKGFTRLPASLKHHLSTEGGLLIHSMNVVKALQDLTDALGLVWKDPTSSIIIGICHDLCKLEFYKTSPENDRYFVYNDTPEYNLGGHGMLSVVIAQKFLELTDEEIHCIRFHMGAYEQKDWSMFDAAIKKFPNVLYTHTADMMASKLMEG